MQNINTNRNSKTAGTDRRKCPKKLFVCILIVFVAAFLAGTPALLRAVYIVDPGIDVAFHDCGLDRSTKGIDFRSLTARLYIESDVSKFDQDDEIILNCRTFLFNTPRHSDNAFNPDSVTITATCRKFDIALSCPEKMDLIKDPHLHDSFVLQTNGKKHEDITKEDMPFAFTVRLKANQTAGYTFSGEIGIEVASQKVDHNWHYVLGIIYFYGENGRIYLSDISVEDAKAHGAIIK